MRHFSSHCTILTFLYQHVLIYFAELLKAVSSDITTYDKRESKMVSDWLANVRDQETRKERGNDGSLCTLFFNLQYLFVVLYVEPAARREKQIAKKKRRKDGEQVSSTSDSSGSSDEEDVPRKRKRSGTYIL